MTIDKHIYFTNEEYKRIKEYSKVNHLSFSRAVCNLSINALNGIDTLDRLSKIDESINHVIKKQKVIYALEEQIYSDMAFDNITDTSKSGALKEFNKKIRNSNINE